MPDPLHPAVVHFPLALAVVGPLLAAAILAVAWRRPAFPRAVWSIVLGLHALAVVTGLLAMRTGEDDEDRIEAIVAEAAIEQHEEAAETFVWGMAALAGLALLPLVLRPRAARLAALATVAAGVAVAGLAYRTGSAGGELVYRHGAAAAFANAGAAAPAPVGREDEQHERGR